MTGKRVAKKSTKDYTQYRYELQVKYEHQGWQTVQEVNPHLVQQEWSAAKKRWTTLPLRLLRDDKVIRSRR